MSTGVDLWKGEQLVLCRDDAVGLRAVIAIHDTTLGPGLGGVRFRPYPDEESAIRECLRLASGMTQKNALAELPFGGAKSIILETGDQPDRRALMRRFGEFIARTGGAYLPGVDMGTTTADLTAIAEAGVEVSCHDEDPSPWTALGVAAAIRAAVEHVDERTGITGVKVVVQGAGHVGAALARILADDGATVVIADVDAERAQRLAVEVGGATVAADAALSLPCDVLAPCAVARVASAQTIHSLGCRILAGAANDTLADPDCAAALAGRGVTYVPDFIANAGGVIHIRAVRDGIDELSLSAEVMAIGDRVRDLLHEADASSQTPLAIADRQARRILDHGRAR